MWYCVLLDTEDLGIEFVEVELLLDSGGSLFSLVEEGFSKFTYA